MGKSKERPPARPYSFIVGIFLPIKQKSRSGVFVLVFYR
jgi:hypothetical protein